MNVARGDVVLLDTCENLFTVGRNFLLRKIGSLPADVIQQVDDCLKAALGIS